MRVGSRGTPDAGAIGESVEAPPGAGLRGWVRGYRAFRQRIAGSADRWETPAGELVLVFGFGDCFHAQAEPGAGEPRPFSSFVAGLHDRPTRTAHHGLQHGMQVRLDPLGAFRLFGLPLGELGNRIVELTDVLGRDAARWTDRLAGAPGWPARFVELDRLLAARMAAGPQPSPAVAWAWRSMRRSAGALRVGDLSAATGHSHRHLAARFRDQIGATPKTAARILRYERAARLLAAGAAPARVAAECGYADQPHLTREFRLFSGITPAAVSR